jgi:hypothetical protein
MARNYAKLGRTTACWLTAAAGVVVTAIPVGYGLLTPDTHPGSNLCFALPLWLGTYMTAKALQARAFQAHRKAGGEQVSGWVVVGFVLLGVALTIGPVAAIAALYEAGSGDQVLHVTDKEEIAYSRDVTEVEARTLGRVLQQQGIFNGAGEKKDARFHKEGQEYVLSVVPLLGVDDPLVHQQFAALARQVRGAWRQAGAGRFVRHVGDAEEEATRRARPLIRCRGGRCHERSHPWAGAAGASGSFVDLVGREGTTVQAEERVDGGHALRGESEAQAPDQSGVRVTERVRGSARPAP